jgi:septum site-determining protein MinD
MAQVIVVTSGKGGVGKTTTSAAFATGLAQRGKKTVVIDFDVGLRNLDLIMGVERRVVFDIVNVIQGEAKLNQALIRDKRVDTLSILPASQTRDKDALTREGVQTIIDELHEDFDFILCDSPAGIEKGALLALYFADQAVVVTNPEVSSVRDSDRILGVLQSKSKRAEEKRDKVKEHLLVTRYDPIRAERGEMLKLDDVREILAIPLLGVVPESESVLRASNTGTPVIMDGRAWRVRPTRTPSGGSSAKRSRTASWSRNAAPGCSSACSGGGPPDELARLLPRQEGGEPEAPPTASQAKERLQIVLAHERIGARARTSCPSSSRSWWRWWRATSPSTRAR